MKQIKNYMEMLCDFYMLVLLAGLPLYTGGSYYLLGDRKYLLFRNASILCIGLWAILSAAAGAAVLIGKIRRGELRGAWDVRLSPVDLCMIFYGLCVLVSTLCSDFRVTAWLGYRDWYMGALSQLLFLGIYFFVSRAYSFQAYPIALGELALLAVLALGFLQRLGLDVTGLMSVYNERDWEYSHMLSTVGNINWCSSYLEMVLPLSLTGFLYAKRKGKKIFLFGVSAACLIMLWVQGSDGGVVTACLALAICLAAGLVRTEHFRRGLLLAGVMCLGLPVFALLVRWRDSGMAMPADGNSLERIAWPGWWFAGAFLLLACLGFGRAPERMKKRVVQAVLALGAVTVFGAAALAACRAVSAAGGFAGLMAQRGEDWGNGRGTLWRLAWRGFRQADGWRKLFGAGPDCFAEVIYTAHVMEDGHWQGAIFTNAHNEWLNQLVNLGLLGTASYLAVFVCSLQRYRRILLGVLAVLLYAATSLFSFQQVMNAPYLFLLLGLCESRMRREEYGRPAAETLESEE